MTPRSLHRLPVVAALSLLVLAGCSNEDRDEPPQDRRLLALLADGRLVGGTTARVREGVSLAEGEPHAPERPADRADP